MSNKDHVRIINPLALVSAAAILAAKPVKAVCQDAYTCPDDLPVYCDMDEGVVANSCSTYADAPYCGNPESDVKCNGEIYRGCPAGARDCADGGGNYDDKCCAGIGPGLGDNIDHMYCTERDADYGDVSFCIMGFDSHIGCPCE